MEEVGTTAPNPLTQKQRQYRKYINATDLGQDFKDLEGKDQLQLNKKILKWTNVLNELNEMNRQIPSPKFEGKWIKSLEITR